MYRKLHVIWQFLAFFIFRKCKIRSVLKIGLLLLPNRDLFDAYTNSLISLLVSLSYTTQWHHHDIMTSVTSSWHHDIIMTSSWHHHYISDIIMTPVTSSWHHMTLQHSANVPLSSRARVCASPLPQSTSTILCPTRPCTRAGTFLSSALPAHGQQVETSLDFWGWEGGRERGGSEEGREGGGRGGGREEASVDLHCYNGTKWDLL